MRSEDVNPEWVAHAMDAFARADGAEIAHVLAAAALALYRKENGR